MILTGTIDLHASDFPFISISSLIIIFFVDLQEADMILHPLTTIINMHEGKEISHS